MNNKKIKLLSSNIVIGIVVTLIVNFFIPYLTLLFEIVVGHLNRLFVNYVDNLYGKISVGLQDNQLLMYPIVLFFAAYLAGITYTRLSNSVNNAQKQIDKFISDNAELAKSQPQESSDNSDENKQLSMLSSRLKKDKFYRCRFCVIAIIFLLLYILRYTEINFINHKITSTLNNIEIISPYVPDYEYKQIKSDFYLTSCKNDYDSLVDKLNVIANDNGITLKK